MTAFHEPALLKEAIEFLNVRPGKKYIDATVGGGGHAVEIVKRGGSLLGIDVDPDAIESARKKLKVVQGNFKNIEKIARENDFYPVAGILYDLGLSSHQLEHSGRGFSFQKDEPLDMRADPKLKVTAANLVNGLAESELTKLFEKYGEESHARAVAGAIIRSRWDRPISNSKELAGIISRVVRRKSKLHPATKVFQALRIAVNDELNNLKSSLPPAFGMLEDGGRLVVISFHSLEDRIVKEFFKNMIKRDLVKGLTRKPVTPSEEEIERNPRARSAKLRAVEKIRNPKFEAPNKS